MGVFWGEFKGGLLWSASSASYKKSGFEFVGELKIKVYSYRILR